MLLKVVQMLVIGTALATPVAAAEIDMTVAGHQIAISKVEDEDRLKIDGRDVLEDAFIYLAWKPDGKPIKVNPAVKEWPEEAKEEIRQWAASWK